MPPTATPPQNDGTVIQATNRQRCPPLAAFVFSAVCPPAGIRAGSPGAAPTKESLAGDCTTATHTASQPCNSRTEPLTNDARVRQASPRIEPDVYWVE